MAEKRPRKALSWENLHFDLSAYIQRCYRRVVFLNSLSGPEKARPARPMSIPHFCAASNLKI
jgi:hypothetical protein